MIIYFQTNKYINFLTILNKSYEGKKKKKTLHHILIF